MVLDIARRKCFGGTDQNTSLEVTASTRSIHLNLTYGLNSIGNIRNSYTGNNWLRPAKIKSIDYIIYMI